MATTRKTSDDRLGLRERLLRPSLVVFEITFTVLIAAGLTLARVRLSVTSPPVDSDPTPLGYTWSLVLFVLPILYLAFWFLFESGYRLQKRAFLTTVALLVPVGFVLDLLFAHTFFTFENTGAVTGIEIPGRGGGIPIEEFVFYATGFLFVLLLYVWCDEIWMGRYNLPLSDERYQRTGGVLRFHKESVIVALALLALAVVYKRFLAADPSGFPWYWAYLLAAAFIPAAGFYLAMRPLINWRAFSFTFVLVLLISLMWEVSLAAPYRWWGYQSDRMMGIFIVAWSRLPLEAVFVWLAVTYTTVIVYEVVSLWLASERKLMRLMLGERAD